MLFLATMGVQFLPDILLLAQEESSSYRPGRGIVKLVVGGIAFLIFGAYRFLRSSE